MLRRNIILECDSYKVAHDRIFPPGTTATFNYLESRGGRYGSTVFFGLQYLLDEYLAGTQVTQQDVEEAADFFKAHGEPFNVEGWTRIAVRHEGRLPIRIKAVAEGTVVPTHNVLLTAESTDPELFWLPGYLETTIVRGCWYPITAATQSWHIKKTILEFLVDTADDPLAEIPFKLHDFGARGVSSHESAGVGGMAHLVNSQGSDTVEGVRFANHYYNHKMAAFSIVASEHSTICAWGKEHEIDAYRNMIKTFGKPGAVFACVSDSYDIYNAVQNLWGEELREEVEKSGATVVIRPDSGNPPDVVLKCLQILERKVGMQKNTKGFKVLPKYFRLIQGDGVNEDSIREILTVMKQNGYSASNIVFGMGGALLQKLDRDTQKFAFKCSEVTVNGEKRRVFKDPVTDPGKRSKAGRLALVRENGKMVTVEGEPKDDLLVPVFENGQVLRRYTLDEVRANAMKGLV